MGIALFSTASIRADFSPLKKRKGSASFSQNDLEILLDKINDSPYTYFYNWNILSNLVLDKIK